MNSSFFKSITANQYAAIVGIFLGLHLVWIHLYPAVAPEIAFRHSAWSGVRTRAMEKMDSIPEKDFGLLVRSLESKSSPSEQIVAAMMVKPEQIGKIQSQGALEALVRHGMSETKAVAISAITDETLLKELITGSSLPDSVEVIVIGKLTDQEFIKEQIEKEYDEDILVAYMRRFKDQKTLLEWIETSTSSSKLRFAAVAGLEDQNLLADYACGRKKISGYSFETDGIQDAAAKALSDPEVILANLGSMTESRVKVAVKKIKDPAKLMSIVRKHRSSDVRVAAMESIADQDSIQAIATLPVSGYYGDPNRSVKLAAIRLLDKQDVLARIALDPKTDDSFLEAAVSRLTNDTILMGVIRGKGSDRAKAAAADQIRN
ncbi:MAG TPA: hypothetical protein PKY05_16975, partial [Fibrobacteria bacterium]|nr:hypothetical protein [Fibrobacteria bacterium]